MDLPLTAEKLIFEYLGFNLRKRRCMAETKSKKTCKLKKLRSGGLFCYIHEKKIKHGIGERIYSSYKLLGDKVRRREEQNNYKERIFMRNKNWNYNYRNFFESY
tara:strand:+ start:211 stop:522 length:312 start_codon:yes stop_codon:yes gene_type:complete